ncbi:MAG: Biotin biosynthesis cytochrome P450 [Alphaproteobacteria bacterium MarineAlpha10_Bin3]|nr:MAG: Biotin biosynthesis cytochrome P450 [Alphaproteobacteria bacterium MarineAlpha10_Bin3]PPR68496.1 MAG: Biotin biosynthesis cytochrome P450 [Alphaproteobacteria bacterium MarineAlpha4_Bin1]
MTSAPQLAKAFDLRTIDAAFLDNPYPTYAALRQFDPVHRSPDGSYFLTRYEDVMAVYRGHAFSSDKKAEFKPKYGDSPLYTHHTTSLVFNDPPLHTRVRKLLAPAFTPRALGVLEPRFAALVDGLLDAAEARGKMDLIEDFAAALPVEIIGDLLGVPRADRGPLRGWSLAILGALEPVLTPEVERRGNQAVADFSSYLGDLIGERRRHPRDDDVLSALITGAVDGVPLSENELIQNCIFLLNAGHETTSNLIGNGVAALLDHPAERAILRDNPDLIETAVEEFLRFESSNQLGNRRATQDVEIGGKTLQSGSFITLCIGAANRDPAQFCDPDRLDIARTPNRHLAFGAGAHACAGITLARMEGRIAIGRLLRRFPNLRRDGTPQRGGRARFRGYLSYPLALE